MENNKVLKNTKEYYREQVNSMGKKEFTLKKMQEYGFWPKNLPTPYEIQENETKEQYKERKNLLKEYEKIINQIDKVYKEKDEINLKLNELRKKYDATWNYEKIREDVSKTIMKESIERRKERKKQRELEKIQRSEAWEKKKAENITFIGKGYSGLLQDFKINEERLVSQGLPVIKTDKELSGFLGIEYKKLRFLVYHRDVVLVDHYHRYTIPKKKGGVRNIAAPKPILKNVQRKILDEILSKISVSNNAHGFLKEKSVISGAKAHIRQTELLINMDLENFFPTITFERVRGMFKGFGYSGYIASLFAMICTYCERMPIEIKDEIKYVKTSKRILPQGSPASPMITNIICSKLDKRLSGLALKKGFIYTRYADDMSFSLQETNSGKEDMRKLCGLVSKIVSEEGFKINKAKTKFLKKNNRQCITGIVINNEELGVPRKWTRRLRAIIHNARKNESNVSFKVINEITGMVCWLKSINEERYSKIIEEGMKVINKAYRKK